MSAERKLRWVCAFVALWWFGEFLADWLYSADTFTLHVQ